MKRSLAMAMVAILLAVPTLGHGIASAHVTKAGAMLTVWEDLDPASPELAELKGLVKSWEDTNNATVNFVGLAQPGRGGTSINVALPLKAKSSEGPDLIYVPEDQTGQFASEGLVATVPKSLLNAKLVKQFKPAAYDAFKLNGSLYGIPAAIDGTFLFYNKKLVKTPPKTWANVITMSKKLRHGDQYGLLWPYNNFYFVSFAFNGYGAPAFGTTKGKLDYKKIELNNAGGIVAITMLANMVKSGLVPESTDYGAMATNFTAGKAAMAITGPWEFPSFSKALGSSLGVANIPTLPNGKAARPYIGVRGWEVNKYSQNQAMAWQLAKYMTFNGQAIIGNAEGRLPVLKSVPGLQLTKLQQGAVKQFKYGVPIPNIPEMGQVWTPIGNAITLVAQGRATPKAAANTAVAQIKAGIAKMHQ